MIMAVVLATTTTTKKSWYSTMITTKKSNKPKPKKKNERKSNNQHMVRFLFICWNNRINHYHWKYYLIHVQSPHTNTFFFAYPKSDKTIWPLAIIVVVTLTSTELDLTHTHTHIQPMGETKKKNISKPNDQNEWMNENKKPRKKMCVCVQIYVQMYVVFCISYFETKEQEEKKNKPNG